MKNGRLLMPLLSLILAFVSAPRTYAGNVYHGKTEYDSYCGLVMAGYQGWFDTPGDGSGRGWRHYPGKHGFKPGSASVELWPDVSEYKKVYKTDFTFPDGKAAYVFSSHDSTTVDLHFKWMKKYGIDGVFMQRFVTEIRDKKSRSHFDKVLDDAMISANRYGRAISVMYDLSGMRANEDSVVTNDLKVLAEKYSLLHHKDNPSFLYHNGKPLVAIWGIGFDDGRGYGLVEAHRIISTIKKMGFSVMIGVPTNWRTLDGDTEPDPHLHDVIKECDILMPWYVGRYQESTFESFKPLIKADLEWCNKNGIDFAPNCYPGFSWHNLKYGRPEAENYAPRNGGSFFKKQLANALNIGAKMIYISMFDEIDEGTAIFKCSRKVPVAAPGSTFLPMETKPEYYMQLVGRTAKKLKKTISKQ